MKKTSLKALLGASVSAVAFGAVAPAYAADLDPEPAKEYVEVCPNSGFRGAILLPGTGVCFKIGGYAKADFIATFEDFAAGDGQGLNEAAFNSEAFNGTGGDRFRAHSLQSRLNFDARTTTDLGSARAFIELDFFNSGGNEVISNSANPRLRHAFVELGIDSLGGSVLAGQTWTNFGDLASYPNTLDFNGPDAQVFARQAQLRWTQPLNETFTLSVSAENPEFAGDASGADNGLDSVPDFTAALSAKTDFATFRVSGLARYLDVDNGANPTGSSDTAFGWGVQGAATVPVGDKDSFSFQVNYGDGIGRYIQQAGPAAVVDASGDLETVAQFGAVASFQHFWSDKLQSNLAGGYYKLIDDDLVGTGVTESDIYAALNLIYSPRSNINVGIEGLYGRTEFTGTEEDADGFRLQTSFQFTF